MLVRVCSISTTKGKIGSRLLLPVQRQMAFMPLVPAAVWDKFPCAESSNRLGSVTIKGKKDSSLIVTLPRRLLDSAHRNLSTQHESHLSLYGQQQSRVFLPLDSDTAQTITGFCTWELVRQSSRYEWHESHLSLYGNNNLESFFPLIVTLPRRLLDSAHGNLSHTAAATSGMKAICRCTGNNNLESFFPL